MNNMDSWSIIHEDKPMGESKINVPWMHIYELQQVVEDIYSSNLEPQRRGYEKLLLWRARIQNLPAGIECTIGLLHVHILDQEVSQQLSSGEKSTYAENDLQLMISSAVMRCVNHISHVTLTYKDTLAKMAKKLSIPKWVIDLRNDTAHRSSLPTLSALRLGVKFSMEWLYENYWKETTTLPGWVISKSKPSFETKYIGQVLDVWQALKMYEINGYRNVNKIPQKDLRVFVKKLLSEKSKEKVVHLPRESVEMHFVICQVTTEVLQAVKSYCFKFDSSGIENVLKILLSCDTFIPPVNVITLGKDQNKELENTTILKWLCSFWSSILVPLQTQYALFPKLIHKLLVNLSGEKSVDRQLIMSLWIKQLCISMIKSEAIMKETRKISENPSDMFIEDHDRAKKKRKKLRSEKKVFLEDAEKRFEERNSQLQGGFLCFPNDPEGNFCSIEVVKFAMLQPTEHTNLFLPNLLMTAKPHIPGSSKRMLEELLSNYFKTENEYVDVISQKIHTVEELEGKQDKHKKICNVDLSYWDRASEFEWSTCPLGLLPWQKGSLSTLDFPSNVTWTSPEDDDHFELGEFNNFRVHGDLTPKDKHILRRKVDWVKHQQKQAMKKVSKKTRNLIKRNKSLSVFHKSKV